MIGSNAKGGYAFVFINLHTFECDEKRNYLCFNGFPTLGGRPPGGIRTDCQSAITVFLHEPASVGKGTARHAFRKAASRRPLAHFYVNFPFSRRTRRAHLMPATRVQIFGQTYSIAGDLDAAYVQKLAAYVDEKMRIISDATSVVDTQKAAVLAALAIADELHSGLRERGEQEELLREQAERCLTLVERALKQTA